jgi:hypothetical protein
MAALRALRQREAAGQGPEPPGGGAAKEGEQGGVEEWAVEVKDTHAPDWEALVEAVTGAPLLALAGGPEGAAAAAPLAGSTGGGGGSGGGTAVAAARQQLCRLARLLEDRWQAAYAQGTQAEARAAPLAAKAGAAAPARGTAGKAVAVPSSFLLRLQRDAWLPAAAPAPAGGRRGGGSAAAGPGAAGASDGQPVALPPHRLFQHTAQVGRSPAWAGATAAQGRGACLACMGG